jgi:hypothetical protein
MIFWPDGRPDKHFTWLIFFTRPFIIAVEKWITIN